MSHKVGLRFDEIPVKIQLVPGVGYLVENQKKRRFFYTGDTGPTDGTWRRLGEKHINCLIIEVSFPNHMGDIAITTGHLTPLLLKGEL
jgi:ribonuclease BN (tRNA processing enzyme)